MNSLNTNTTSGFFRVIHKGGLPITEVTFDFMANLNPAHAPRAFDVDNANIAPTATAPTSRPVSSTTT